MTTIDNSALSQANAQMESVREMVAALEVDYDRLEELRDEKQSLEDQKNDSWESYNNIKDDPDYSHEERGESLGEYLEAVEALYDWIAKNKEELESLSDIAGDNESLEQAEQTIHEDALCVEVRSDWQSLGDDFEPTQYRIVLCTGGPHVQIVGELDEHREPRRAWLEYADWGTGMVERVNQAGDQEALLSYSRCFYFGA